MEFTKYGEGKVWGKNISLAEDGTLFQRVPMYAPDALAKRLNNALGRSRLRGLAGIDSLTRWNAQLKATVLFTSLFHHQAFLRSYWFGTPIHGDITKLNPVWAYREGRRVIDQWGPEIQELVLGGLRIGGQRDLDEVAIKEKTWIGKQIDKVPMLRGTKNAIVALRDQQLDYLFHRLGPNLKVMSALLEYRHLLVKHKAKIEAGTLTREAIAITAAKTANTDFGGLNLQREGRDPTHQHIFRLLALAPDWTESNVRSMALAFKRGEEGAAFRGLWARVILRAGVATIAFNFLMAGMDDDDDDPDGATFLTRYQRAWREGNFRWLEADITPLYRLVGGDTPRRKYFSILGHFRDPVKFLFHPGRSAKHKSSILSGMVIEAASGTDWAGRHFTSLNEILGIDDQGVYKTSRRAPDGTWLYRAGDPKGGKLTGQTVAWRSEARGPVDIPTLPSFVASQAKGSMPIQAQSLMAWLAGEIDGFDAVAKSLGMMTATTREKGVPDLYLQQRSAIRAVESEYKEAGRNPERARKIRVEKAGEFRMIPMMKKVESRLRKIRKLKGVASDRNNQAAIKKLDEQVKAVQAAFSRRYQQVIEQ